MQTVQLFVTCLVDGFFPEVGRATVRVLERQGVRVAFPAGQTCCGQPAFNAGYRDRARAMARHLVRVFDGTEGPIVTPSGSCAEMLIRHVPELLTGDPLAAAAIRVAGRVRELTTFLVDDLGMTDPGVSGEGRVAYHRSCHGLRGLGLAGEGESLVERIEGMERCELDGAEECCGFGGLFAIELPEVSGAMLETKLAAIEASGADVVTGGDVSCLMHIAGGLHRRASGIRVRHVAELLGGPET